MRRKRLPRLTETHTAYVIGQFMLILHYIDRKLR